MKSEVVIAGISCRLAGIRGAAELWQFLQAPSSRLAPLPPERWQPELYKSDIDAALLTTIHSGALIKDFSVDFRALRIPPLQLERMHRMDVLAVGTMCEALLDAGVQPSTAPSDDAQVIVAAQTLGPDPSTDTTRRIRRFEMQEPVRRALADLPAAERADVDELVEQLFNVAAPPMEVDSLLTSSSIIAGRLANIFNFRGGHHVVDAGAASSLAALQQGFDRINSGEASLVVVAAVSPILTASSLLRHAASGLLGASRPFDPESGGVQLGEGCIAVVLRRADRSQADAAGKAYAAIERVEVAGCAESRNVEQLRAALGAVVGRTIGARKEEDKIRFVTSRAAGCAPLDAVEKEALEKLGVTPCLSSQANHLGHLQSASGLLALAEAALCVEHRLWPKTGDSITDSESVAVCDAGFGSIAGLALLRAPGPMQKSARPKPALHSTRAADDIAIVALGAVAPRAANAKEFWLNTIANVEAIGDLPVSRFDAEKLVGSGTETASMLQTRLAGIAEKPNIDWQRLGLDAATVNAQDPALTYALAVADEAVGSHALSRYARDRIDVVFGQLPLRAAEALLETRVLFAGHLHLVGSALRELGWDQARIGQVLLQARVSFECTARHFDRASYDAFSGSPVAMIVAKAFGAQGLVATLDAACASAMVALKIASDRLRSRRADVVLAGGVAYNILPELYLALSMLGFLSADAAPPFSRGSNGFVPAEGAGCVVLKRKADALADGDHIIAIIAGIGHSSDGRGQAVLAPNTDGQQLAIRRALAAACVAPADIDVLEAHGAGTSVGDEVEMHSYAATYGELPRATPLAVGALKSQIGHTSSASGILGVIKTALSLDARIIAPSNLDDETRASLPFGRMGFEVATTMRKWFVLPGKHRFGAVTSIGIGGANYHVVLERPVDHVDDVDAIDARPGLPPRGTYASRFVIDRMPQAIAANPTLSLGQRHIVLVADAREAWRAVEQRLVARGASVSVLAANQEITAFFVAARSAHGRVSGVIDLSMFDAPKLQSSRLIEALGADNQRFFALARAAYDELCEPDSFFYAATALGGEFGLRGGGDGHPFGAARQGFLRALKQEVPSLDAKAIDFAWGASAAEIATALLLELADRNDRTDTAHRDGQRFVPVFTRKPFPDTDSVLRSFGKADVVLFTGGGRGVTYVCAKALANRGVRTIVCGRTIPALGNEPWLALDQTAFAAFKQDELVRRRKENPPPTPVAFQREMALIEAKRELATNLIQARALGLDLHYVVCDVTDARAVTTLIEEIRAKHGALTGIVHGAMVETSRSLPSKSDDIVHATFATKVGALVNLWQATLAEPLRAFICFGSGAGRFGNRGQSDYAAANALMAHLLATFGQSDARRLHHATINWTAWEGTGAAVSNPELKELVRKTGVSSIRPEEGEYWFMSEMMLGRSGESLIFDERMLHDWPFMGSRADGQGTRRRYCNSLGELLVPGEFPLIDTVNAAAQSVERVLDVRRDAFISQHRLYDTPILPATFGIELLSEAAAVLNPGYAVRSVQEYLIHTPSKLHRSAPLRLHVAVRVQSETAETRQLVVESHSKLVVKGRTLQELRLHHSARVTLQKQSAVAQIHRISEPPGVAHARSFFHMATDPVGLGPIFSRAAWIKVDATSSFGRVRAPRLRDLFSHTISPRFVLDPIVMDAAFQIAANWDGLNNDFVSIPFAVAAIEVGRGRKISEDAQVIATAVKVSDPDVHYDLVIVGESDEVLLKISGLHLRRISRLGAGETAGAS